MVLEKQDKIIKHYRCNFCNKTHTIEIDRKLLEGKRRYPFPYIFLHDSIHNGNLTELITILYLDKEGRIRGQEIQKLGHNNLFSKEQVISIIKPLINEIEILRKEIIELKKRLK